MKCKYYKKCKGYKDDSYTCNQEQEKEDGGIYCGTYKKLEEKNEK